MENRELNQKLCPIRNGKYILEHCKHKVMTVLSVSQHVNLRFMLPVEECVTMQKQAAIYNRWHISHTPLALSPSTPLEECPSSQILGTVYMYM